jgi:hypothetical protein
MRSPGKIAALAIAAFLSGCSSPDRLPQAYAATVERIEELPGKFYYSPEKGQDPLFRITLDVADPSGGGTRKPVRVLVLDVYKPSIHGRAGDCVLFGYPGSLPKGAEVNFENLSDYRIVPGDPR